jgi:hypothetical protein
MRGGAISSLDEAIHPEASGPPRNHSSACYPGSHACRRRRHGAGGRNDNLLYHVYLAGRHQDTRGRMILLSPVRGSPG